jgi:signal transduction histidine kinase
VDIPEDIPEIETDRGKLQQVLLNLVNNAFQALDNGCNLDIKASPESRDRVSITISDNGCGMSQENLSKIFEPFFTTKEKGQGTGLGLAITYALVKKLQGNISVASKENEGTTFTITLPTLIDKEISKDDELLENIDYILEAVERCGTITRQLLGFSRKYDVKIQKVNLNEVISDVIVFHKKEAEYRNINVYVDVAEDIPEIETDRGKLQQVLLNLVNNAFQAVDDGCNLDIDAAAEGRDKISITISDNGCGMSEENLSKIFEPFFTTKERDKGTGLGLTITYGLVKKLQGNISVKSKEMEGTTFIITLPIRMQEEMSKNENSVGR